MSKADSIKSQSESISKRINGVAVSRYAVFCFLMIAGCASDLITKQLVFARYFAPEAMVPLRHWWIDGWLGIETSTNQGALWGHGKGMTVWFVLLSIVALVGIVYWLFVKRAAISWVVTTALGLISGGILGNLYDRMGLWHGSDIDANHAYAVRDWIHFRWVEAPGFLQSIFNPWPNFNIADGVLVCGAILLLVHAFFFPPKHQAEEKEEAAAEHE